MAFCRMAHGVVARDDLLDLAVVSGTFTGEHVRLAVARRAARDIRSAYVAGQSLQMAGMDRDLRKARAGEPNIV